MAIRALALCATLASWAAAATLPTCRDASGVPCSVRDEGAACDAAISSNGVVTGTDDTTAIVQINHPRFRVTALFDAAHWNGTTWPPPFSLDFDALEVLAGYTAFNIPADRRFDEGVRDFYTLIDHGRLIAPLGNSDTHDLNWVLDGTTRMALGASLDAEPLGLVSFKGKPAPVEVFALAT